MQAALSPQALAVYTVTAPLVIAPGMAGTVTPWPTDRTISLLLTQDGVGGHTITYDESLTGIEGGPLPSVRTGPGESTLLILVPVGGGWWVGRAGLDWSSPGYVDNGDGTLDLSGSLVTDNGDGTLTIGA